MYNGSSAQMTMTALVYIYRLTNSGHLMELEFAQQYSNWNSVGLNELFDAQVIKTVKPDMKPIADNLKRIGRDAQVLVIWTDNDLEGENIGIQDTFKIRCRSCFCGTKCKFKDSD